MINNNFSHELRRLAQSDYMIDTAMLPDGILLCTIAGYIEKLEAIILEEK